MPPNLSQEAFLASPGMQQKIAAALFIRRPQSPIGEKMSESTFERDIWDPARNSYLENMRRAFAGELMYFSDRTRLEPVAKAAVRAAIVPPFALTLSIMGAILHVFKTTSYLSLALGSIEGRKSLRFLSSPKCRYACAAVVACLATFGLREPSALASSEIWRVGEQGLRRIYAMPVAEIVTFALETQSRMAPIGAAMRTIGTFDLAERAMLGGHQSTSPKQSRQAVALLDQPS